MQQLLGIIIQTLFLFLFSFSVSFSETKTEFKKELQICQSKDDNNHDNFSSCHHVAQSYENGNGIKKDLQKAKYYYSYACLLHDFDQDEWTSCEAYKTIDTQTGEIETYKKACDSNDMNACYYLGSLYTTITSGDIRNNFDKKKSDYYFNKACQLGYPEACLNVKQYKQACILNKHFCDLSVSFNNNNDDDFLFEKDYINAQKYHEKACDLKNADSCKRLGMRYNPELNHNIHDAPYRLSVADVNNIFFPWDNENTNDYNTTKAIKYYQKACELNDIDSCFIMYNFYKNTPKAQFYFNKSLFGYQKLCSLHATGCYRLGRWYEYGKGVKKDLQKAKAYHARCEFSCTQYVRLDIKMERLEQKK